MAAFGPAGDVVLAVIPGTLLIALGVGLAFPEIQGATLHATSAAAFSTVFLVAGIMLLVGAVLAAIVVRGRGGAELPMKETVGSEPEIH